MLEETNINQSGEKLENNENNIKSTNLIGEDQNNNNEDKDTINNNINESNDDNEIQKQKIKKLLNIREKIQQLNKDEYYEIFKIIKEEDENYSSNKNGVMFDLLKTKESTIDRISGFLKYSQEKNRQINNDEFNRDKYKELLN